MAQVFIDNEPYEVDGSKNVLETCLSLGLNLPYFCWHPAMHSVGACRQCAVIKYKDETDKKGKVVMACMEPVAWRLYDIRYGDCLVRTRRNCKNTITQSNKNTKKKFSTYCCRSINSTNKMQEEQTDNKGNDLPKKTKVNPFPIVAIGASVGGLKAFSALLENLSFKTGMAFIFVQHLSPTHKSLLTPLLSKITSVNGKQSYIKGKAFVEKNSGNAKLKVQFFWPLRAKYWIIDLADDYSYAVVSNPNKKYLWILSRTPKMNDSIYQQILSRLKEKGFDLSELKLTQQI